MCWATCWSPCAPRCFRRNSERQGFDGIGDWKMEFQWDFIWGISPVCIPKLPSYSKETSGKSEGNLPMMTIQVGGFVFFFAPIDPVIKMIQMKSMDFSMPSFFCIWDWRLHGICRDCWPNWMCRSMASFVLNSVICCLSSHGIRVGWVGICVF